MSISQMNLETKDNLETKFNRPFNTEKNIFDDWNHQNQLENVVVYHHEQNKKKLESRSRENEFGDKKIIWRQTLIVHKRRKYFFEGWNHLDLLDIIPV